MSNEAVVCQKCQATAEDLCDQCGKCECACPCPCEHGVAANQHCSRCEAEMAAELDGEDVAPEILVGHSAGAQAMAGLDFEDQADELDESVACPGCHAEVDELCAKCEHCEECCECIGGFVEADVAD